MPTPPDDILLNKAAIIERCIRRLQEEAQACPRYDHFTHVDALTLNVERACQASIDMAMHVVAERHLGVPQSNAEAFALLEKAGIIDAPLAKSLRGMAGFRNIAVHQYEELDMEVLRWVVESGHRDWIRLGEALGVVIRP
jgi:uncharacterized protein YutE (UPF0331/DUF86 family)